MSKHDTSNASSMCWHEFTRTCKTDHSFRWLARGFFVCLCGCVVFVCFVFTSPKICFVFISRRICFVFTSRRIGYISRGGWCQRFLPPAPPPPLHTHAPASPLLLLLLIIKKKIKKSWGTSSTSENYAIGIPLLRLELTVSSDSFFPTASVHRDV